jgi:Icc-related predicted phosphoesterase
MKLLCLSDIHGEGAGLKDILAECSSSAVDAVVVAGDLTHLGGYAEAQSILAPLLDSGIPLLCVAGNMDGVEARRLIIEKGIDLHGRGVVVGGFGFLGLGGGPPSAFGTPWELPPMEARAALSAGLAAVVHCPHRVLVSHAPPRGTKIDRSFAGLHVGSLPVREFILAGSVDLCICGHIHEASGEDSLGRTLCVNVGPFKNGSYALVDLEGSQARVTWRKR